VEGIKNQNENCQRVVKKILKITPPPQDTYTKQSETKRFTLSILPINLNHRQLPKKQKKRVAKKKGGTGRDPKRH